MLKPRQIIIDEKLDNVLVERARTERRSVSAVVRSLLNKTFHKENPEAWNLKDKAFLLLDLIRLGIPSNTFNQPLKAKEIFRMENKFVEIDAEILKKLFGDWETVLKVAKEVESILFEECLVLPYFTIPNFKIVYRLVRKPSAVRNIIKKLSDRWEHEK